MDWTFGFLLGNTSNHGMEIGEAYSTASQTKDGDAASWQSAMRFAVYGISGGGGLAPQAAMNDPRIKAVAVHKRNKE
jgi:hypothetical protein